MKSIKEADFTDKKVLLRVDYNVPLKDGKVVDEFRIIKSLPTIKYLLKQCKQLILVSHLGRPKGKVIPNMSLAPAAVSLSTLLDYPVAFIDQVKPETIPEDAKLVMLENLRFDPDEDANGEELRKKLASYADVFVEDAFAFCHRPTASIIGVPTLLPSYAGFQLEKELKHLDISNAERPLVAVIGGAKLETKIPVMKNFLEKCDHILIGGGMIFTFYKAQGLEIGKSLVNGDYLDQANEFLKNPKVVLPIDVAAAKDIHATDYEIKLVAEISNDDIGLDLGPDTMMLFKEILKHAKTVIWNGPLGYYENENFAKATIELAEFLAELDANVIIGGGDTAAVVNDLALEDEFTHVSTGGGASLVLLSGEKLVGVEALK